MQYTNACNGAKTKYKKCGLVQLHTHNRQMEKCNVICRVENSQTLLNNVRRTHCIHTVYKTMHLPDEFVCNGQSFGRMFSSFHARRDAGFNQFVHAII